MRRATKTVGLVTVQSFNRRGDPAQSEEAEMITAEQKIVEKVFSGGRVTKFPIPTDLFHMILIDARGYLDQGGDRLDYLQMAYGTAGIPPGCYPAIHHWRDRNGKPQPIRGLFEHGNPLKGARCLQERIHVLGFTRERRYVPGEIGDATFYTPNPHLFRSDEEVRQAFGGYPLRPRR